MDTGVFILEFDDTFRSHGQDTHSAAPIRLFQIPFGCSKKKTTKILPKIANFFLLNFDIRLKKWFQTNHTIQSFLENQPYSRFSFVFGKNTNPYRNRWVTLPVGSIRHSRRYFVHENLRFHEYNSLVVVVHVSESLCRSVCCLDVRLFFCFVLFLDGKISPKTLQL